MNKPISILDKEYLQWVKELSKRYRQSQIKAAVKVNTEMLKFYWSLGRDIVALKAEARWGSKFFVNLSRDLKELNPKATCFSPTNLLYMKNFFRLYQDYSEITPQVGEQFEKDIFSLPWGHHKLLIDKFLQMPQKALFYVRQTVANGWSRNVLHNFIDSSLYERQGKALSNFNRTLPDDLYYKKFPTKRRYFSLWQSKQLKHPNMRAISPSLGSCFISSLFMQKQFRYFWLSFNPFSNSSIVGIDDLKSFGKSLES